MSDNIWIPGKTYKDHAVAITIGHLDDIPKGVHIIFAEMDIVDLVKTKVVDGIPAKFVPVIVTHSSCSLIGGVDGIIRGHRIPFTARQRVGRRRAPLVSAVKYLPAGCSCGWCHNSLLGPCQGCHIDDLAGPGCADLVVLHHAQAGSFTHRFTDALVTGLRHMLKHMWRDECAEARIW